MREHNTVLVIRALWEAPDGLSRADLARQLGLSRSTISAIVHELIKSSLVVESHRARSTGGRRAIVLQFNDGHQNVLGVDLGSAHISVARLDLRGRVLDWISQEHDVQNNPDSSLVLLEQFIRQTVKQASAPILGMGVGVPCPVDADSRHHLSPQILPAWRGIQLGSWLLDRFQIPTFLDNDANMGALAEAWWGAGQDVDHFAYIKIGTGIGAGYIINGQPYRGASGIAGEIGHTTVNTRGRSCRCGLRGCLEAEVGFKTVLQKARHAHDNKKLSFSQVLALADEGDPAIGAVFEEAGVHLGMAIADLLNLFNPGRVILGGRLTTAGDRLLSPLRQTVRERALSSSIDRAEIILSTLGDEHIAVGAATLVVQNALLSPHYFLSRHQKETIEPTSSPHTALS